MLWIEQRGSPRTCLMYLRDVWMYSVRPFWSSSLVERTVKGNSTGNVRSSFDFSLSSSSFSSSHLLTFLFFAGSNETVRTSVAFVCWVCSIAHIHAQEAAQNHLRDWYKTSKQTFPYSQPDASLCVTACVMRPPPRPVWSHVNPDAAWRHQCAAHVDYCHDAVPRRAGGCPSVN